MTFSVLEEVHYAAINSFSFGFYFKSIEHQSDVDIVKQETVVLAREAFRLTNLNRKEEICIWLSVKF